MREKDPHWTFWLDNELICCEADRARGTDSSPIAVKSPNLTKFFAALHSFPFCHDKDRSAPVLSWD